STHDTKRSEDVRARLNVLSELPGEWEARLQRWSTLNEDRKVVFDGNPVPDRNQEIFLYQTMLGAWPLDPEGVPAFKERLKSYMIKAAREAMVHTRWISPQTNHESALLAFVNAILDEAANPEFLKDFLALQERLAYFGALNSISQVLLKIASPGVPDFYQGTELWNFSLVDPDNRRPVDFAKRTEILKKLKKQEKKGLAALAMGLLSQWRDGRLKLYITYQGLKMRRNYPEIFRNGTYLPLTVQGKRQNQVVALARRHDNDWVLAVAGRFFATITPAGQAPVGQEIWGDSDIILPPEAPVAWEDIFTGKVWEAKEFATQRLLPLHKVLQHLPVAFLSGSSSP
ncbi:MAG: malto-oligosyltrehalose synthase, partial [Deltaproteobacteria bacterium]|nr:malto-oligosyltrehalose synthase [Deltaproteobacteria bacterium]